MIKNRDIKELQTSYHYHVQVDTAKLFTRTGTLPSYQELQIFGTYSKIPESVFEHWLKCRGGLPVLENVNVSNFLFYYD